MVCTTRDSVHHKKVDNTIQTIDTQQYEGQGVHLPKS
jgi:hypothetical protein